MSTQQQRIISTLIFIAFISFQFSCKSSGKNLNIVSISKGIEVSDKNYYFSENADIEIEDSYYSLRSKAEYNNGKVAKLIVFHPEGELSYEHKDLVDDPKLLSNYGYSIECKVEREGDKLIDSNNIIPQTFTVVNDKIFKTKKDQFVVLYTIK